MKTVTTLLAAIVFSLGASTQVRAAGRMQRSSCGNRQDRPTDGLSGKKSAYRYSTLPSTLMAWPEMFRAAGDARNKAIAATSWVVTSRRSEIFLT